MGSQWVRDLETIATALLTRAQTDDRSGGVCSFCGAKAPNEKIDPTHSAKCPVALAQRVVDEIEFVHRARPPL